MKWLFLLVAIGLAILSYNQQKQLDLVNAELAKSREEIQSLRTQVKKMPNPFLEQHAGPPGSATQKLGGHPTGNPLDPPAPNGLDGPGGAKRRH